MESKYLVGFIHNQPAVMWDKIQDFEEIVSEDGQVTLKFKEDGVEYEYHGTPDRGYAEINHKAPNFDDYQYMGRRTALRHDLFNPQVRSDRDYRPTQRFDFEDDELPSIPRRQSRRGNRHNQIAGCGHISGCGGSSFGGCGL